MAQVTARFRSTPQERARANAQLSELVGSEIWRKPAMLWVALLLLVVFNPFRFDHSAWLQIVIWPVVLVALFLGWPRLLWWRNSRRRGGEEIRTVSDQGLAVSGAVNTTFPWSRIRSVAETKDYVFFLLGPGAGHFIPKSVLGAADLEMIRAISGDKFSPPVSSTG